MYMNYLFKKTYSYTRLSIHILAYAIIDQYFLDPILSPLIYMSFINFCGITTSFHSGLFFNRNAITDISLKYNISVSTFHKYNILIHFFPCIISYYILNLYHFDCNWKLVFLCYCYKLLWAILIHGSLNLSSIYLPFTNKQYYTFWSISFLTQCFIAYIL